MYVEPGEIKGQIINELLRISKHCLVLMEPFYGKEKALFHNSHLLYYEDMKKYLAGKWIIS